MSFYSLGIYRPNWRQKKALAGQGVVADLGSHIIDMARMLVGDIGSVTGVLRNLLPEQWPADKGAAPVIETDTHCAMMVRFEGGAVGYLAYDCARRFERLPAHAQDALGQLGRGGVNRPYLVAERGLAGHDGPVNVHARGAELPVGPQDANRRDEVPQPPRP
jgi:hypothetical protein